MNTLKKTFTVGVATLLLGACAAPIANKSPDELYRYAMKRQLTHDNQYNFVGSTKIEWQDNDEQATGTKMWVQHFVKYVSSPVAGAIDLPRGRLELIPELRYETRQSAAFVRMPMLLDVSQKSIVVDPAAFSDFLDHFERKKVERINGQSEGKEPIKPRLINGKLVRFTLPKALNHFPFKEMFMTLPDAIEKGYMALDKNAFQRLELDDLARQLGAKHRIHLRTNVKQSEQMTRAMLTAWRDALQNQAQQDEGVKKVVALLNDVLEPPAESKRAIKETDADLEKKQILEDMHWDSEIYLDGRGRLLAMNIIYTFPKVLMDLIDESNKTPAIQIKSHMRFKYNKNPVFTLQSTPENTVDLIELAPELVEQLEEKLEKAIGHETKK